MQCAAYDVRRLKGAFTRFLTSARRARAPRPVRIGCWLKRASSLRLAAFMVRPVKVTCVFALARIRRNVSPKRWSGCDTFLTVSDDYDGSEAALLKAASGV